MVLLKHRGNKRVFKNPYDKHHILYIRTEWERGRLDELRLHPYCIVDVHRDTLHRYIHTHLACIPAPRERIVQEVLYHLQYLKQYGAITLQDPLEARLKILISLFEGTERSTTEALKWQLELVNEFKKSPYF